MNALEFAVKMELDGEKYYTGQAEVNKGNKLNTVCALLAKDEKNHAQILNNKMNELPYELVSSTAYDAKKNIFSDIESFKSDIVKIPSQLEFYRMALEKEKQSIDLYTDFLLKAVDDGEKKLFEYLKQQEEQHYEIIQELVMLLRHAEDWVESAEFGIRKDY